MNRSNAVGFGLIAALCVFIGVCLWLRRGTDSPTVESMARLNEVKELLLNYAEEQGELPGKLSDLAEAGQVDTEPLDRRGKPFRYQRISKGSAELTDLGADGARGGHMFKADRTIEIRVN